jgi:CDP-paratose 2-epimerase
MRSAGSDSGILQPFTLITGGAGFIGVNLADRLATEGRRVLIYDNLSRPGVESNLQWLCATHGGLVQVEINDIRNAGALRQAVRHAAEVFHCAGQVAVTTSVASPVQDFEINARGTLHLLEAIRTSPHRPPLLFTSTNKVYGSLPAIALSETRWRLTPTEPALRARGVSEGQPLDFHSPYGCSKGAADQYVLDYARIYGLRTVVFRMSCIYGPHQFGTEDQGWVAHFLIKTLRNEPITIYGSGKQVRDILFVDDLLQAFRAAMAHIRAISGRAFNIGGGVANSISLREFINYIRELHGGAPDIEQGPWRPGDQLYYVSNTESFQRATGWQPGIHMTEGLGRLHAFLTARERQPAGVSEREAAIS